ncbi:MAG TPA: hypothetical protein VFQ39_00090 [Longimicrobium sp.]|nr:hypothetical protein [Longimicrobium sp.]
MSQVLVHQAGPLPIKATVPWPTSNPVLLAVSGSAWTQKPNTMLAVTVTIHAQTVATLQLFANQAGTHMAFPTAFSSFTGDFGEQTITITAANDSTITDQNDVFTIGLIF